MRAGRRVPVPRGGAACAEPLRFPPTPGTSFLGSCPSWPPPGIPGDKGPEGLVPWRESQYWEPGLSLLILVLPTDTFI